MFHAPMILESYKTRVLEPLWNSNHYCETVEFLLLVQNQCYYAFLEMELSAVIDFWLAPVLAVV